MKLTHSILAGKAKTVKLDNKIEVFSSHHTGSTLLTILVAVGSTESKDINREVSSRVIITLTK